MNYINNINFLKINQRKLTKIKKYFVKYRTLVILLFTLISLFGIIVIKHYAYPIRSYVSQAIYGYKINPDGTKDYSTFQKQAQEEVLPRNGVKIKITLGDTIPKLVSYGVIDIQKVEDLYKTRGGLSSEQRAMLTSKSSKPLTVTAENATWLVNMLWPLGLANKMEINNQSPVDGKDINNFASTGGWSLGKEESGGVYFNQYSIIPLTVQQEKRVKALADKVYRPCCNNSTFFQDCNHGSAALALIELGVSQNLPDEDIYKALLAFNSYWFPQNYVETALYLKVVKNKNWNEIDPKLLLSKDYSSIGGWLANVDLAAQKIVGLLPQQAGGGSCGA